MSLLKKKKTLNTSLIEKYYNNISSHLEYPQNMIYEHFIETAIEHPNYIAYEYFGREVTYQMFIQQIAEAAKALKGIGVCENEVITICAPNIPEAIIMFYAINMIGCVSNIIHPLSSENEILNYLKMSNSTRILTIDISVQKIVNILKETKLSDIIVVSAANNMRIQKKFLYWLAKGRKMHLPECDMMITWSEFIPKGIDFQDEYIIKKDPNDPAVILYSGGTSGTPKGILLSNLNFNALAVQAKAMAQPNNPGDTILCIMPIFHGFGLGVCLHTTLCIGMKCVLIPAFSFKEFKNLIKKYQPNFVVGVPSLFESLLSCKLKESDLKCVKNVISGGDIMAPELKRRIDAYLKKHGSKARIRVGYGLTEGTAASCLTLESELRERCIGVPFPDMEYKIVKIGTHDEAPRNTDGEICISGPTVMLGYLNNTKETMQTLRIHEEDKKLWLHTGDIGSMDEEGMIFFQQRLKRVIISSGYNIYPSYIENVIDKHEAVLFSTVIGIDHPYKVQVAKAFIVLKDGYKPNNETLESIKKHCEKNIAKYSLPYEYEFRTSIPKTKVGKIAFNELINEEKSKKKN